MDHMTEIEQKTHVCGEYLRVKELKSELWF